MKNYERTKIGAFFYRMTMACGRFLFRHPILAQILNLTWGILGTLAGVIEMLVVLLLPKKMQTLKRLKQKLKICPIILQIMIQQYIL